MKYFLILLSLYQTRSPTPVSGLATYDWDGCQIAGKFTAKQVQDLGFVCVPTPLTAEKLAKGETP